MSICQSGIDCKPQFISTQILITVEESHPLIKLGLVIPWRKLADLVFLDLQKTKKGKWWLGRKLKLRIHLGVYLLQQIFNKTDRDIERELRDNAAYQVFCGRNCVDSWHTPDHTKIEEFRSRLSLDTHQQLANFALKLGVDLGFGKAGNVDVDSTVQEANMSYPADSGLLKKLGTIIHKISNFLNQKAKEQIVEPLSVNLKKIATAARSYFFLPKNSTQVIKKEKMSELLNIVIEESKQVIEVCKHLKKDFIEKLKWNERRAIEQIKNFGEKYLKDVKYFLASGKMAGGKRLSFHLNAVACFMKGKPGKKYQFGRAFQLGRIEGNFIFVAKNDSVQMPDKTSLKQVVQTHEGLFGKGKIDSLTTDKGYYSRNNEKLLLKKGVKEIGIQRPQNIKKPPVYPMDKQLTEKLANRRSGIEPLIGHLKQGGQLGRSRMKSDKTIEASGYTSVLGFNLRQISNHQGRANRRAAF